MYNLYEKIAGNPQKFRQFTCRDSLITIFNCPLVSKYEDIWCHHNYVLFVKEGRKVWHTAHGSYDLRKGSCVFVRKGANIIEQFFDSSFCLVLFFVTDEFIGDVVRQKSNPLVKSGYKYEPIIKVDNNANVQAFFQSMMPYFDDYGEPDESLLELKFRELILILADNPNNAELQSYFASLLCEPRTISLRKVMEDNFCFNLRLEEYAQLSNRSLSAFKRDFQKQFNTTPGKWLLEKRLLHARHLICHMGKTVSESAFESGFESPSHFSRSFRQRFGIAPASAKQQVPA